MAESNPSKPPVPPEDRKQIGRVALFLSLVYVVEGLGQTAGLISQPLNYYLKEVHGWTPVQISSYTALFMFPWIIKPVFGLISDFVPLFGYRRKSYLVAANALGTAAYLAVGILVSPSLIAFALLMTSYAMAISSTLCGAVLVENGQRYGANADFVNKQWLWYNVAAMAAAIGGGQLVQWLSPASALHTAAFIVALAPLIAIAGALLLLKEEKSTIDVEQMKAGFAALGAAVRTRQIWVVAAFLFLCYFSPGFNTPLYYYLTDTLKFSQGYIGILNSINSAGWVAGALLFSRYFGSLPLKTLIYASIAIGTLATLSYVMLAGEVSAAIVYCCGGLAAMTATVATLTLAADYCPKKSEGFSYAVLMSVTNLAVSASDIVGSFLYEHVFGNRLTPLILVSAGCTALTVFLVPMLGLENRAPAAEGGQANRPATP